jgi:hypothetical protein
MPTVIRIGEKTDYINVDTIQFDANVRTFGLKQEATCRASASMVRVPESIYRRSRVSFKPDAECNRQPRDE